LDTALACFGLQLYSATALLIVELFQVVGTPALAGMKAALNLLRHLLKQICTLLEMNLSSAPDFIKQSAKFCLFPSGVLGVCPWGWLGSDSLE
jgi:hypothetical protein